MKICVSSFVSGATKAQVKVASLGSKYAHLFSSVSSVTDALRISSVVTAASAAAESDCTPLLPRHERRLMAPDGRPCPRHSSYLCTRRRRMIHKTPLCNRSSSFPSRRFHGNTMFRFILAFARSCIAACKRTTRCVRPACESSVVAVYESRLETRGRKIVLGMFQCCFRLSPQFVLRISRMSRVLKVSSPASDVNTASATRRFVSFRIR
jgi:hypothetical protein